MGEGEDEKEKSVQYLAAVLASLPSTDHALRDGEWVPWRRIGSRKNSRRGRSRKMKSILKVRKRAGVNITQSCRYSPPPQGQTQPSGRQECCHLGRSESQSIRSRSLSRRSKSRNTGASTSTQSSPAGHTAGACGLLLQLWESYCLE